MRVEETNWCVCVSKSRQPFVTEDKIQFKNHLYSGIHGDKVSITFPFYPLRVCVCVCVREGRKLSSTVDSEGSNEAAASLGGKPSKQNRYDSATVGAGFYSARSPQTNPVSGNDPLVRSNDFIMFL